MLVGKVHEDTQCDAIPGRSERALGPRDSERALGPRDVDPLECPPECPQTLPIANPPARLLDRKPRNRRMTLWMERIVRRRDLVEPAGSVLEDDLVSSEILEAREVLIP